MPQLHIWQALSMCDQNSVGGQLENFLHQERTHAEWFTHSFLMIYPHEINLRGINPHVINYHKTNPSLNQLLSDQLT